MSGCVAKRRLRIVDLPEPEGPEMTIGRVEVILAGGGQHWIGYAVGAEGGDVLVGAIVSLRELIEG